MKIINAVALLSFSSFLIQPVHSVSLGFIKRGFKSCTDSCTTLKVCDDQKSLDWCVKNCSHKIDPLETKKMCTQAQWDKVKETIAKNKDKLSPQEKQLYGQFMDRADGKTGFTPEPDMPATAEDTPPPLPPRDAPAQP